MESPYTRAESDAGRQRGEQAPQKYHQVGNNYREYGEQSGYLYNPWSDEYYIDPNAYSEYQEQAGITKPTPGLLETVGPLAGASLAMSAGQTLGGQIPGMLSGIGGMFGGGGATAATTGAVTAPTGLGAAMGASPVAGVGGAGTAGASGGLLGLAPIAGVAGGLALGAKGIKDLFNDKETKGLEGWGGRATLGIATGGLSEVARGLGLFKETTNVEDKKLQALKDQGILPEDFKIIDEERSRSEQAKDLRAKGQEVSKFLDTGNVADLTAKDIQGYATLLERNPNDQAARLKDAQDAINAGAVREGKGSISVDWDKVNEYRANNPTTSTPTKPLTFSPDSPEYMALSKDEKDLYWKQRNG